jgi:hypothetical protein
MALSTFSVPPRQDSDATFRAWGSGLSTALAAAGLTKLSAGEASGQIDWATVAGPGASTNTSKGYEFWRFSDALHTAGSYVFLKIEYGSGAAGTSPAIWLTVGTSHDGAGSMTGLTTTRYQVKTAGNSTTSYTCRVAGGTDRIAVAMWESSNTANYALWFSVERTKDSAGANTATGVLVTTHYTAVSTQRVYTFASGETGVETNFGALLPSTGTGASGSSVAVYPIFFTTGVFLNPIDMLILAFAANFTVGVPVSFTYYGSTKTYMPLQATGYVPVIRGSIAAGMFLMRNE